MKTVSKEVKDKSGALISTITVQQAESFDECAALAGSPEAAIEVFNRHWVILEMNKARPGRSESTGARQVAAAVKQLSPEVQALLKGRTTDEIAALLEAAGKKLAKNAA